MTYPRLVRSLKVVAFAALIAVPTQAAMAALGKVAQEVTLPDDASVLEEKLSPSGSAVAVRISYGDAKPNVEIHSLDIPDSSPTVLPAAPDGWVPYSHHWRTEEELTLVYLAPHPAERGTAADYRIAKWSFGDNALEFITQPEHGFFTIIGHLDQELFLFDDTGPTKVFQVVDPNTGETLRSFDWIAREGTPFPWLDASDLPEDVRELRSKNITSFSIKATGARQVPGTHWISILLASSVDEANHLVTFDLSSLTFMATPPAITRFFDEYRVTSFAWSPDGTRLWCAVGPHNQTVLYELVLSSGESRQVLAPDAGFGIRGAAASKILLRGIRVLSPAVAMEDIPDGTLGTIYRPFIYDLESAGE